MNFVELLHKMVDMLPWASEPAKTDAHSVIAKFFADDEAAHAAPVETATATSETISSGDGASEESSSDSGATIDTAPPANTEPDVGNVNVNALTDTQRANLLALLGGESSTAT